MRPLLSLLHMMPRSSAIPSFFAAILGFSQASLGEPAWGLVGLPFGIVWLVGIYAASVVGRRLGAGQIHQLLAVLEANLLATDEFVEDSRALSRPREAAQSGI